MRRWLRRPFPWSFEARTEKKCYQMAMDGLNLTQFLPLEHIPRHLKGVLPGRRAERIYIRALVRAEQRALNDRATLGLVRRPEPPETCACCGERVPAQDGVASGM
jgi:hypothetical protein